MGLSRSVQRLLRTVQLGHFGMSRDGLQLGNGTRPVPLHVQTPRSEQEQPGSAPSPELQPPSCRPSFLILSRAQASHSVSARWLPTVRVLLLQLPAASSQHAATFEAQAVHSTLDMCTAHRTITIVPWPTTNDCLLFTVPCLAVVGCNKTNDHGKAPR